MHTKFSKEIKILHANAECTLVLAHLSSWTPALQQTPPVYEGSPRSCESAAEVGPHTYNHTVRVSRDHRVHTGRASVIGC